MRMLPRIFAPAPTDHAVAQRRMPFSADFAGAAQGYALIQQHVFADLCRFTNHHAHAVIDEESPADGRARMNFDAGDGPGELAHDARAGVYQPAPYSRCAAR